MRIPPPSPHRDGERVRRQAQGYCAEGPGFYVWDEDPREVSRLARDLARGAPVAHESERPGEPDTG